MDITAPNNCNFGQQPNPLLSATRQSFSGRIFSYYDFDKVIKDTLYDDVVIQNVRQTSPYAGSQQSFDNIVVQNLYYQYLQAYLNTRSLYKQIGSIRNCYIVHSALRVLTENSLAADPFTGEIFRVTVDENHPYATKAQLVIDRFMEHFQIDRIIESIIADAIFYGEYAMTLQTNKGTDVGEFQGEDDVGITKILMANPPGTIFGVWEAAHPSYYVRLKKNVNMSSQLPLERLEPSSVWSINIFPQALQFSLGNGMLLLNDDSNRIEQYMKIGAPLFHTVYSKVLELEAFEQAQYQKELGDIRRRGIIGVQAPSGQELDQLRDFSRYYEKMLNEHTGPGDLNALQGLGQIMAQMSTLSYVRVIPQQPDRGKMDVVDLKVATDNIAEKIIDRRKIILESIGIPYDAVYGQIEGGKTNLRQYVQFMRLIKQIQNGVSWSLKRLLKTHLIMQGIDVTQKDIDVHFYKSVNVSELDTIQATDTSVQYLRNYHDLMMEMIQNPVTNRYVNVSELMRYYDSVFSQMEGIGKVIIVPERENLMGDKALAMAPGGEGGEQQVPQELQDASNQVQNTALNQSQQDGFRNKGWPKGVSSRISGMPPNVKMSGGELPPNVKINS